MTKKNRHAEALIEALPYLQKFRGQTMVIKYGGAAMENEDLVEHVLRDVIFLETVGIHPVVVHGGGKAITRAMKEQGIVAEFVDGLRISDPASMAVIEKLLGEEINPAIVAGINRLGGRAQGVRGQDVFTVRKLTLQKKNKTIDLGLVGEITGVRTELIQKIIEQEMVPVISPLGCDEKGQVYNVNADIAASEVAMALQSKKIIYLTDVNGLMRDPQRADSTLSTLTIEQIKQLKDEGIISGGMIPKVDSAVVALQRGVEKAHFLDGRVPHSMLAEIFTDGGCGTEITAD
jgi:acetylglutamate kinase